MILHALLGWFLLFILTMQIGLLFFLEFKINHFIGEIKDIVRNNGNSQSPPEGKLKFSKKIFWLKENIEVIPDAFQVRVMNLLIFHKVMRLLTVTFFLLCILFALTQK